MQLTLRAARVNTGLSQREAARKMGISEDTLSKYERGLSAPGIQNLEKILKLYGVNYDNLIFCPKNTV